MVEQHCAVQICGSIPIAEIPSNRLFQMTENVWNVKTPNVCSIGYIFHIPLPLHFSIRSNNVFALAWHVINT